MRGPKSPIKITLKDDERSKLIKLLECNNTSSRFAKRINTILMIADGQAIQHISDSIGLQRRIIREWGQRFIEKRIDGLFDTPRPGRPRKDIPEESGML